MNPLARRLRKSASPWLRTHGTRLESPDNRKQPPPSGPLSSPAAAPAKALDAVQTATAAAAGENSTRPCRNGSAVRSRGPLPVKTACRTPRLPQKQPFLPGSRLSVLLCAAKWSPEPPPASATLSLVRPPRNSLRKRQAHKHRECAPTPATPPGAFYLWYGSPGTRPPAPARLLRLRR